MTLDAPALAAAIATHGPIVRILVTRTAGSTPRGPGTAMLVTATGTIGTIGGGTLEHQAITRARAILATGDNATETIPLGPALGQCCGGAVTLLWERHTQAPAATRPLPGPRPTTPPPASPPPGHPPITRDGWIAESPPAPAPLWIWGAGRVGRALVHTIAPLDAYAITWIDLAPDQFPTHIPPQVTPIPADDPTRLATFAPVDAHHLILTRSHDLDLALCHALLARGFASCGLIGSATKWARFRSRLQNLGHPLHEISSIACPIGDPDLGKHPQAIAIGVTAALLRAKSTTRVASAARRDGTG
jgi:xanthine dehydrogenase accessory factor